MNGDANHDSGGLVLLSMRQLSDAAFTSAHASEVLPIYQSIAQWIRSYLMRPHPELGRSGDVCPFTAQAFRLDTIRIGVSEATGFDVDTINRSMRYCFQQFTLIPCARSMSHYRTIVVGFPKIDDAKGLDGLKAVQARLKFHCLLRGLMIGRFYPGSDDAGLWNPDFRPLRSPIPILAIRELVENDVPFTIRHPLIIPAYLWRHARAAPKRLRDHLAKRR